MKQWTAEDYLMHHGIKGMKWGIRRYQNKDGSLTAAGEKRYRSQKEIVRDLEKKVRANKLDVNNLPRNKEYEEFEAAKREYEEARKVEDDYWRNDSERRKYAAKLAEEKWPEAKERYGWTDDEKDTYVYMHTD